MMAELGDVGPCCPGCGQSTDAHAADCPQVTRGWRLPAPRPAGPVHICRPPIRDVWAPVPGNDRARMKTGTQPDGAHGDVFVCGCGRVYQVAWCKGHDLRTGEPIWGPYGSFLYVNLFDQGPAWRQRHGLVAWRARRRAVAHGVRVA